MIKLYFAAWGRCDRILWLPCNTSFVGVVSMTNFSCKPSYFLLMCVGVTFDVVMHLSVVPRWILATCRLCRGVCS